MTLDWVQLWSNLAAAFAGGAAAAIATWLAVGRQQKLQSRQQTAASVELHEFLLVEQNKALTSCIHAKATQNDVAVTDLDKLEINYHLFERNRENLLNLPDRELRESILETMNAIQHWSVFTRQAITDRDQYPYASPSDGDSIIDNPDWFEKKKAIDEINRLFPIAINQANRCTALATRLREKRKDKRQLSIRKS